MSILSGFSTPHAGQRRILTHPLKRFWEDEFLVWEKRDLSGKEYAYIWADGIYFNVRLDESKSFILVVIGADTADRHGRQATCGLKAHSDTPPECPNKFHRPEYFEPFFSVLIYAHYLYGLKFYFILYNVLY